MDVQEKRKHVIDIVFPIALFFVFTVTALMVILLAADVYSDITVAAEDNYTSRTALSYITEKVRQNDENGSVSFGSFDGCDCIIFSQEYDGQTYDTYIYEFDNALYELFVKANAEVSASDGTKIMEVSDLQIEQLEGGFFYISCRDSDGNVIGTAVSVQSTGISD